MKYILRVYSLIKLRLFELINYSHIIFNPFTLFPVGLNLQRRNAEVSLRMLSLMVTFLLFFEVVLLFLRAVSGLKFKTLRLKQIE